MSSVQSRDMTSGDSAGAGRGMIESGGTEDEDTEAGCRAERRDGDNNDPCTEAPYGWLHGVVARGLVVARALLIEDSPR